MATEGQTPIVDLDNLWPEGIEEEVRSPRDILLAQAVHLGNLTRGVVKARVATSEIEDDRVSHAFILFAPHLGGFEYSLFDASHSKALVYPVLFRGVDPYNAVESLLFQGQNRSWNRLRTEEEFTELLRKVLQSSNTRSVIDSLKAMSRERMLAAASEKPKPSAASST